MAKRRLSARDRGLLRLINAAERRVDPLYQAAHQSLLAFHGLGGMQMGLLWKEGHPAYVPIPDPWMTEEQAAATIAKSPRADEMIPRGFVALTVWTLYVKLWVNQAALTTYVSGDDVWDELRAAVRGRR